MESAKIISALHQTSSFNTKLYEAILAPNEATELEYKSVRDTVVFTNKRIIIIDVQGLSGTKKEFLSIPYSKMNAFSGESAGTFDLDAEIKIWVSSLHCIQLQFIKGNNIRIPLELMSRYSL